MNAAPPRPYTEYNIFFQIERAYILQNLGVIPDIAEENRFSADDPEYADSGRPPLPARYDGIILPSDWYIPGKTKRKKRQHRASHGKISFTDLTKSISSAWRSIDNETKIFCAQLSDSSNQEYKQKLMETRRASDASADSETKAVAARSTRGKRKSNASESSADIAVSQKKKKPILPTQLNQNCSLHEHEQRFQWPDFTFSTAGPLPSGPLPSGPLPSSQIHSVSNASSSEVAAVTTHPHMFNMNTVPVNAAAAAAAAAANRYLRADEQSHRAPCVNMTDDDILGMYMNMKR